MKTVLEKLNSKMPFVKFSLNIYIYKKNILYIKIIYIENQAIRFFLF